MSVEINIPQFLQHYASGAKVAEVNGGNVGECLAGLVKKFPQLKPLLFDKSGRLHSYLDVFVNRQSAYPEELAKPVSDGDELHIINIIVGG
ncbi:MAG: MoaD/ThiS family protein [Chloroflexi bacterium]|nr:MoaD/ThiS family protein [Chloroflexota bacterium]